MGVLGEQAAMLPVTVQVRSFAEDNSIRKERDFKFHVFVQQKWTPYLMMVTLFNSISGLNDYREECTYRVSGNIELAGAQKMSLLYHAGPGRNVRARAHGVGRLVGRQIQPAVSATR